MEVPKRPSYKRVYRVSGGLSNPSSRVRETGLTPAAARLRRGWPDPIATATGKRLLDEDVARVRREDLGRDVPAAEVDVGCAEVDRDRGRPRVHGDDAVGEGPPVDAAHECVGACRRSDRHGVIGGDQAEAWSRLRVREAIGAEPTVPEQERCLREAMPLLDLRRR